MLRLFVRNNHLLYFDFPKNLMQTVENHGASTMASTGSGTLRNIMKFPHPFPFSSSKSAHGDGVKTYYYQF